jgi:hypothetical protein
MAPRSRPRRDDHPRALRALHWYAWVLATGVLAVQGYRVYRQEVVERHLSDFGRLYYAVIAWRQGGSLYGTTAASPLVFPDGSMLEMINVASPAWHLVVWPFTALPPSWAFLAWLLANLLGWALSLRICVREWDLAIGRRWLPVIMIALLASPLVASAFHTGQYVGLLMLPATCAWRAARRGRWTQAGLWLGAVAAHKPFVLALLAWMAWHRLWPGAAGGVAPIAVTGLLGAIVFGTHSYTEWSAALAGTSQWTYFEGNASIWAPWARAFEPQPEFAFVDRPSVVAPSSIASAAAIGALSWWSLRRRWHATDAEWSALWLAVVLMSPLGWIYYLWLGVGPLGGVIYGWWCDSERRWRSLALGTLAILPFGTVVLGQPSVIASFTVGSRYTWAVAVWWGMLLWDRERHRAALRHAGTIPARV